MNFTFRHRTINQISYAVAAQFIDDGRIKCAVDAQQAGVAAIYDPGTDTIVASDNTYGSEFNDEKGILIHEVAHAILDYYGGESHSGKKTAMTVLDDETMAYIAQAIYMLAARNAETRSSPLSEAIAIVRPKLNLSNLADTCKSLVFTDKEILPLQTAIRSNPLYRDEVKDTATHNGLARPKPADSPF